MLDSELAAERDYHARVRQAMALMRDTVVELLGRYESDFKESRRNRRPGDARPDHNMGFAMGLNSGRRLEELADRDLPLFFGRLWLDTGEDYHLGRRHIRDESDRSVALVVDWRAPLAGRFYRASVHDRQEVIRRRRFGFSEQQLTSLEDEDLLAGEEFSSSLLSAEIERPRSGPMRDIVATIQPEQDELIRRGIDSTLCVQGAPGTGKTAVGLHRAAWLLYSYGARLSKSGMLVVGPNEGFLSYISGVLPTLGETSVRQVTVDDLTGASSAKGEDDAPVAALKHDARMAEICARAVWAHQRNADQDLAFTHGGLRLGLTTDEVTALVRRAGTGARSWSAGRKSLEDAMASALAHQAEVRTGRSRDRQWIAGLKREPEFKGYLNKIWPRLTAKQVLRRLYAEADFRARICGDLLTEAEAASLQRTANKLSAADAVLIDELEVQLHPTTTEQTYGHIVVDEAQDLSAMQCRVIARRSPNGALTVLGDLAQGTTPWAAVSWAEQMSHLGHAESELTELSTGYRVPAAILELANGLLPHLAVSVPAARSVRRDGLVELIHEEDLVDGAVRAVEKALVEEGMVGVIAHDSVLDEVRSAIATHPRVELVPARLAKGLEFDHVVLLEPAAFVGADARAESGATPEGRGVGADVIALRHLYVAVTRAVSRLTVVHSRELPHQLITKA